jgi:hypothetical protein
MPFAWKKPAAFLRHKGRVVYHSYKDDNAEEKLAYWYGTDPHEDEKFKFDIRDLKEYDQHGPSGKDHRVALRAANDNGFIKFPKEAK